MATVGQYALSISDTAVTCWSDHRLTFEPKGWMRTMREELGASLKTLARPSPSLYACYSSDVTGLCDAENILFYNVGASPFTGLGVSSVVFERSFEPVVDGEKELAGLRHRMSYSIEPGPKTHWRMVDEIANFETALQPSGHGMPDLHVECLWLQMRRALAVVHTMPKPAAYGLCLQIEGPQVERLKLMPSLKRLFNGVIAGFHTYAGRRLDEVSQRLGIMLGISSQETAELLLDDRMGILGPRELIWPFGSRVQWNPADDLCLHGSLMKLKAATGWRLRGQVFTIATRIEGME